MRQPLVVVGDCLLDRDIEGSVDRLCPDAPVPVVDDLESRSRAGGAGLAACLAAAAGNDVTLVTALAADVGGAELRELLDRAGVEVIAMRMSGSTPEKVRVRADGRTLLRLDRGGGGTLMGAVPDEALRAIGCRATLVSDYGRGMTSVASIRHAVAARPPRLPAVWDPHPRGARPVVRCDAITPNRVEAGVRGASPAEVAAAARRLAARWRAANVVVTMGEAGALMSAEDGPPLVVPAPLVASGDPCGAGDCFAATAAGMLADGATPPEAVRAAVVAASAFVAAGGAAAARFGDTAGTPLDIGGTDDQLDAAVQLAARVRARGGRVVATGGCFDLLHAGHVASLRAARALGDCLIVCLNSDESVRRLKGAGRPVVTEADRAEVLSSLGCVDAVVIFDEATPEKVLNAIRPEVFAKGGDYEHADLPEAALMRSWGGEAVLVPYVPGHSTSNIVREVKLRAV